MDGNSAVVFQQGAAYTRFRALRVSAGKHRQECRCHHGVAQTFLSVFLELAKLQAMPVSAGILTLAHFP